MKSWLKENWFKLGILILIGATVTIATLVFLKIEKDNNAFAQQKYVDQQAQNKRDYVEKRQKDCLDIYNQETKKWNNVTNFSYDENDDTCIITYKAQNGEWKGVDCSTLGFSSDMFNCTDNTFTESF